MSSRQKQVMLFDKSVELFEKLDAQRVEAGLHGADVVSIALEFLDRKGGIATVCADYAKAKRVRPRRRLQSVPASTAE